MSSRIARVCGLNAARLPPATASSGARCDRRRNPSCSSPVALTSTTTVWADVPGIAVPLPSLRVNDKIAIGFHGNLNSIIMVGFFRLVVNEATVDVPILEAQEGFAPTGGPFHRAWNVLYTSSAGGDVTVKLQWKANAGGQVQAFMPVSLTAHVLRP